MKTRAITRSSARAITRNTIVTIIGLVLMSSVVFAAHEPTYIVRTGERIISPDHDRTIHVGNVVDIYFPAGAVDEATLVQYSVSYWKHSPDPELTIFFSPEGLVFNFPVEITVKMKNSDYDTGDLVTMYYFDTGSEEWEPVDDFTIGDPDDDYTLSLEHFSLYAFTVIRNGDEE